MRPQRVFPNKLKFYDKLHTRKIKMFSGNELTVLHLIKETTKYFISLDSWASCCSIFKKSKKNHIFEYNIPILNNVLTIKFLNKESWDNWINRNIETDSDIKETMLLLNKLFPDKKKTYFPELSSIIYRYCSGSFIRYDDNMMIEEPTKNNINDRNYFNKKYNSEIDLTETFKTIGENSIIIPYAFTYCCVKGSAYENAGDIFMVMSDDTIYFEIVRHF